MILYLVRHGIAIDRDDPACPAEAERYLTQEGVQRTREAARGIRRLVDRPGTLLSSPYVRARQTAEIVAKELGIAAERIVTTTALLPEAAPAKLFRELGSYADSDVMAFGHAPNVDEVIAAALGARGPLTELKKCGMAALEFQEVAPARGRLLGLYTARALRLIG